MPDRIPAAYLGVLREAIAHLGTEAKRLTAVADGRPTPSSMAAQERSSFQKPTSIDNASSIAVPLIELGAEHLSVFNKILVEPVEVIASWTCVRSMLESCALAAWLLDPGITSHARVSRVFALRYEDIQQEKILAGIADPKDPAVNRLKARIEEAEKDATSLGFKLVLDKHRHRIGIGEKMPSATSLITAVLDEGTMYRILSGIAHGHTWAIRQVCYVEIPHDGDPTIKAFEKRLSIDKTAVLGSCAVRAFIRALWNQCRYFGWDHLKFEELFEKVADDIGMSEDGRLRFWRDGASVP